MLTGVGLGFRLSAFGFRLSGFGFRVSGFGFRVSGFGFEIERLTTVLMSWWGRGAQPRAASLGLTDCSEADMGLWYTSVNLGAKSCQMSTLEHPSTFGAEPGFARLVSPDSLRTNWETDISQNALECRTPPKPNPETIQTRNPKLSTLRTLNPTRGYHYPYPLSSEYGTHKTVKARF